MSTLLLTSVAILLAYVLIVRPNFIYWSARDTLSFYDGVVLTYALVSLPSLILKSVGQRTSQIYGLDHGSLNLDLRSSTWWMSMGYWKNQVNLQLTGDVIQQEQPRHLPSACRALLDEVLDAAGLLRNGQSPKSRNLIENFDSRRSNLNIIDVGFGCGDQTFAVCQSTDVAAYIGITLDTSQCQFAQRRLTAHEVSSSSSQVIKLFNCDAASPEQWPEHLKQLVQQWLVPEGAESSETRAQNWLLGIDTMYHFKPSREPLLRYAHHRLKASIASFDLLLSERPLTWSQRLLLRVVCRLFSAPYCNFLTPAQYRDQLISVGYAHEAINIRDISEHVFGPLSEFLEYQDRQLSMMKMSIGKFRAARWLFRWWARSGIVRGCIIVAHHSECGRH